jgi:HD superfamily phosphohydrolase
MNFSALSDFEAEEYSRHNSVLPSSQVATVRSSRQKVMFDPVWGDIHLDWMLIALIDTPYFQRLRHLKQLGTTYYVFPGAAHNRFEHSIGTAHLAGQVVRGLMSRQPELRLRERDVLLVAMAGLCHDLGHGPFSHVFDNEFLPAVDTAGRLRGWKHEVASEMMLDAAIRFAKLDDPEEVGNDFLTEDEITFVKQLINPPSDPTKYVYGTKKQFLYEIVSNPRNSIDVDKFDYLSRDARNCGIRPGIDVRRLMNNCRVINNQICYHQKVVFTIYELFHARYTMFKQIYSHRAVKAVEYMVRDALILADPHMHIADRIHSADDYLLLDDRILAVIAADPRPELAPAQALLRRIDCRDIYKFAIEGMLPQRSFESHARISPQDVLRYLPADAVVAEEDIIIQNMALNYAKKDKNPVDHVRFFENWDSHCEFPITREQTSLLSAAQFQERYVRVFCKNNDEAKVSAVKEALNTLLESECNTSVPNPPHGAYALTQERIQNGLTSPSKGGVLSRSGSLVGPRGSGAIGGSGGEPFAARPLGLSFSSQQSGAATNNATGGSSSTTSAGASAGTLGALGSQRPKKSVSFSQMSQEAAGTGAGAGHGLKRVRTATGADEDRKRPGVGVIHENADAGGEDDDDEAGGGDDDDDDNDDDAVVSATVGTLRSLQSSQNNSGPSLSQRSSGAGAGAGRSNGVSMHATAPRKPDRQGTLQMFLHNKK